MAIMDRFFLDSKKAVLVVVDIQEKLCMAMDQEVLAKLTKNTGILLEAAKTLDIPVIATEQYVKGLGPTIADLDEGLRDATRHEKMAFSCCGCGPFVEQIRAAGRKQIVVVGMETHVCVLQTVIDLLNDGFVVHLVGDAVMSRSPYNRDAAIGIMRQAGAVITCTESVLFQWLKVAGTESFKKLSKLVR